MKTLQKLMLVTTLTSTLTSVAFAEDIKLGESVTLTGPIAKYGSMIHEGFTLAASEINAQGGVNGKKIVLVSEDDQGKKEETMNVFKKFIFRDKVLAILGPTTSNSAFAADPIANASKVVVFGTSNTATGVSDIGPYVFRNSVMESDVLPETVKAAVNKFGVKKVAVMYANDDAYTTDGFKSFQSALKANNIATTTVEGYSKTDVDFKAQLTKIKATNPDAIVCSCFSEDGANIILQARALGMKQPFIGGNGFNSTKLFDIAKNAADNTLMGSPWSSENKTAKNVAFMKDFTTKYGHAPDQFAAQAYDAIYIIAAALKNVQLSGDIKKDRQALRDALPAVKLDGVTGQFAFRPANGNKAGYDADQKAFINIAKDSKYNLLK